MRRVIPAPVAVGGWWTLTSDRAGLTTKDEAGLSDGMVKSAAVLAVAAMFALAGCSQASDPMPAPTSASTGAPSDATSSPNSTSSGDTGQTPIPSSPAAPADPLNPLAGTPESLQEYVAEYLAAVMSAYSGDSVAPSKLWQTAAAGFNRPNVTVRVEDVNSNGSLSDPDDRVVLAEVIDGTTYAAVIIVEAGGGSYSVSYPEPVALP